MIVRVKVHTDECLIRASEEKKHTQVVIEWRNMEEGKGKIEMEEHHPSWMRTPSREERILQKIIMGMKEGNEL